MAEINPGDVVRVTGAFTNAAGTAADPTAVSLKVRPKGGAETSYTGAQVTKDSVGNYHVDYLVPAIAPHHGQTFRYQWTGTGAVTAVEEGSFTVTSRYE